MPQIVDVLVNPERIVPPVRGPLRFPFFAPEPAVPARSLGRKQQVEESYVPEMKSVALTPGHNQIPLELWEGMQQNPAFAEMRISGVIELLTRDPEKAEAEVTGTTVDYQPPDAIKMVRFSNDLDWLKECLLVENRDLVKKDIKAAIAKLEKKAGG
jgi:hypothetical protein